MSIAFSRRLALIFGILLPLAELVRRSGQLGSAAVIPHLLDDFLLGGSLLYAAALCRRDPRRGRLYLAAAWGAACGMGYNSFMWQLLTLDQPDPAPISSAAVAAVKGIGLLLCLAALLGCLREPDAAPHRQKKARYGSGLNLISLRRIEETGL
ncbi:hypothetical protein [Pseudoduganella aquatica]|uniref:Uncharacterized protein n=1 Tax=Pseudoduganella aquatica TaxID=2660641 RepID=A0A7X4HB56_9BURK|nr:hypothetical protein [Pseudoduganella aquatica]MYN07935.1 hypothetical protein [Pseudoduganella aquatica]